VSVHGLDASHAEGLLKLARELVQGSPRIMPSLHVLVGRELFTIPRAKVSSLIYIPAEKARKHITTMGSAEVLTLNGNVIPLVRLADALGRERFYFDESGGAFPDRRVRMSDRRGPECVIAGDAHQWDERKDEDGRRHRPASDLKVVVVNAGTARFGLVVDELSPGGSGSDQVIYLR
jgi:two-component system, chemotaxis family, sensor kinase CheA